MFHTHNRLAGKRLVDFVEVDLLLLQAGLLEHSGDSERRANAHDPGRDADDGGGDKPAKDGQPEPLRDRAACEKDGSGPIRHLGRVAGVRRSVVVERGFELCQAFLGHAIPDTIIDGDDLFDFFLSFWVHPFYCHGDDLVLEPARLEGVGGPLEGLGGEGVLLFTSNLPFLGDIF